MNPKVDLGSVTLTIKCKRAVWNVVALLLFRPFATKLFRGWRVLLLRCFGARIEHGCDVYASAHVWAPWNLVMNRGACIGPGVQCYNQALVTLGEDVCVSQEACLCTAGHTLGGVNSAHDGLLVAAITLQRGAWVGMRAFIGMGVVVGERAVVGATASVFKDVEPDTVVGGNPAVVIKRLNGEV